MRSRSSTARGQARRRQNMEDQVPEEVKADRLARLQDVLIERSATAVQRDVASGKMLPVLFEKAGRRAGQLVGRSPYLQAVACGGRA